MAAARSRLFQLVVCLLWIAGSMQAVTTSIQLHSLRHICTGSTAVCRTTVFECKEPTTIVHKRWTKAAS